MLLQVGMAIFPMHTHQLVVNDTIQTLLIIRSIRGIVILVLTFQIAQEDDHPLTMMIHLMTVVHADVLSVG
jgi:hypothetical protein